jgi:hypothetical protein
MSRFDVRVPARSAAIEAVITRADGTVEHLGTISYWHKNPLRVWAWRLSRALRGKG